LYSVRGDEVMRWSRKESAKWGPGASSARLNGQSWRPASHPSAYWLKAAVRQKSSRARSDMQEEGGVHRQDKGEAEGPAR
jgi:hypothetical protein